MIESVQKKFVIYALRRSVRRDDNFRLPSYISRCETVGIDTLEMRRLHLSVFFIYDLLTNRIDAPELRSLVIINIPTRHLRTHEFLTINRHRTNYGFYEPLNQLCMAFNAFAHLYDDSVQRNSFRNMVKYSALPDVMPYERYLDRWSVIGLDAQNLFVCVFLAFYFYYCSALFNLTRVYARLSWVILRAFMFLFFLLWFNLELLFEYFLFCFCFFFLSFLFLRFSFATLVSFCIS